MREQIKILCATDCNYAKRVLVMLISLFENNKEHNIKVYVLVENNKSEVFNQYYQIAQIYKQSIEIIEIPHSVLIENGAFEIGNFSLAIYYRILAAKLLPNVEKILYLDGDICVTKDIVTLWRIDISNYSMAVVKDACFFEDNVYVRLKYSKEYGYFNSGVLYMNLDYWRKKNVTERCLEHLKKYGNNYYYVDQDVLNSVLINEVKWMPLSFNFQVNFLNYDCFSSYDSLVKREIRKVVLDVPLIIHFVSPTKPWNIRYFGKPYSKIWRKYQQKSPYPFDYTFIPINIRLVKQLLKKILWKFGLYLEKKGVAPEFKKMT